MVTVHKMNNREYCETAEFQFSGLSTDDKPTEWHGFPVGENSLFFEEDTGDFYYLKQQGNTVTEAVWEKIGGGSQPSGELIYEKDITQWVEDSDYGYYYTENEQTEFQSLPETITVIWDGDEYSDVVFSSDNNGWGAIWDNDLNQYDWSTYPFSIYTNPPYNIGFSSQTGGEHTVKIYG